MKYQIERVNTATAVITEGKKGVHMFLLEGENRALLIDTGTGEGNLSECIKKLTDKPVLVVNTHGHYDHMGGMDFCDKPEAYVEALQRLQKRVTPKTVLYSNHHENPVPQEYIQKYITCATKIMERPEEGVKMKYGAGLWDVMVYEDVKLTFDR